MERGRHERHTTQALCREDDEAPRVEALTYEIGFVPTLEGRWGTTRIRPGRRPPAGTDRGPARVVQTITSSSPATLEVLLAEAAGAATL